jgi:energy-converting hydrogenase A subunit R
MVREGDGLPVSFNGNDYAVREAEIVVMSHHTIVTSILADVFSRYGREAVFNLADDWSLSKARSLCSPPLIRELERISLDRKPIVKRITTDNKDQIMQESRLFRKTVRGAAIGRLG